MIRLETGIAAADGDIHAISEVERHNPDRRRAILGHHDRPDKSHILEPPRAGGPCQRRPGLGHGLHSEDGREQQVTIQQVIGKVRVGVSGQFDIGDQFDARIVHTRPVDEPGKRQLTGLKRYRRQAAGPAHDHHG